MKNTGKYKRTGLFICIGVILAILTILAVILIPKKQEETGKNLEPFRITTNYGDLFYPKEWEEMVQIQSENKDDHEIISFGYAKEQADVVKMFDIVFGKYEGSYLGEIRIGEDSTVPVYIRIYDISNAEEWEADELAVFYEMQEDVNFLLERLPLEEVEDANNMPEISQEETGDILIEIPYGQFILSEEWRKVLRIENEQDKLAFWAVLANKQEYHLFDIYFGDKVPEIFGYLITEQNEKVPIGFQMYSISQKEELSVDEKDQLLRMQEEINYLLEQLNLEFPEETEDTKENPSVEEVQPDLIIQTPAGELTYPGKWGKYLVTEEPEESRLCFYAKLPDKESVALFEIIFGDDETDTAQIKPYKLAFAGDWTGAEKDIIYEMMESINHISMQLQEKLEPVG